MIGGFRVSRFQCFKVKSRSSAIEWELKCLPVRVGDLGGAGIPHFVE
jgi:hypothetical protein